VQVRAEQEDRGEQGQRSVMALLVHGDAAFAALGVVSEALQLSDVPGFTTGGTVHVIINNQGERWAQGCLLPVWGGGWLCWAQGAAAACVGRRVVVLGEDVRRFCARLPGCGDHDRAVPCCSCCGVAVAT